MKVKHKIPAKINLTLDVKKTDGEYHEIRSLVCSVDIYDTIILKKRKDELVTLKEKGIKSGSEVCDNNAVKSAIKYMQTQDTCGVDIILKKKIPVGAGLGGSSADASGTLVLMEKLYKKNADVISLANTLGSDTGYMVNGGLKVISGRGDIIDDVDAKFSAYLLFITDDQAVSTKKCYQLFDKEIEKAGCTDKAIEFLKNNDMDGFVLNIKNDLYAPALNLLPILKEKIIDLKKAGAKTAIMTGSGSAVYGIFFNEKQRDFAYRILIKKYGKNLIKAKTL